MSSINYLETDQQSRPSPSPERIRICYLVSVIANEHSGTERHLLRLVRSLDRQRFDPRLVALQHTHFADNWEDPEVPLRTLGYRAFYRPSDWLRTLQFANWLRREKFHIIELHSPEAQFVGALAAKLARVPMVVSCRRNMGYGYGWKEHLQTRLTKRFVDCFLANSTLVIDRISELESIGRDRFKLIHNGVDLECFDRDAQLPVCRVFAEALERSTIVSIAANLRPVKNLPMFLRAAKRAIDVRKDLCFVLLGAGPNEAALKALAAELGIQQHVLFLGARVPVAPYLTNSAIGCLSSDSEGFSNALIEYMAAGLPVVATNVGGAAEAVEDGATGFLVPAGDDVVMSQRLLELIDNRELRQRMGQLGRQRVEQKFSLDREVNEYVGLYEGLLHEA